MTSKNTSPLNVKGIAVLGLLGAIMFAAKMVMVPLPNIEPVSLLIMVYTVIFGMRALYPIYVYVMLEIMVYGVNLWTINYLYVWAILALLAWLFRRMESPVGWAILSGVFGLAFGALCTPLYFFTGGWQAALVWWVNGLLFDIFHCVGNFAVALVLFAPCRKILTKLSKQVGLI